MSFSTEAIVAVSTVLLLDATLAMGAPVPKAQACSIAKMKATTRAFGCQAGEQLRIVRGGSGDFEKCLGKLTSAFDKAELRAEGACPTTGDVATAQSQIEEAVAGLFDALQAPLALDDDSQRCLQKQIKAAKKFASCASDTLSARATGVFAGDFDDIVTCRHRVYVASQAIDENYSCVAPTPVDDLVLWTGGGFAYLPSYTALGDSLSDYLRLIVPNGDLSGSDFSGASMSQVDARQADFSDATLVETRWDSSDLTAVDFSGADLTGSVARGAVVESTVLGSAILEGSCWRDLDSGVCPASLPAGWTCQSSWIAGKTMDCSVRPLEFWATPIAGVDLSGLDLSLSDFSEAVFDGGTLAGSDLSSADFEEASFENTDLSGCDLSGASLGGVRMEGVNLTGADLSSADLDNGSLFEFDSITGCPALPSGYGCFGGMILGPFADASHADLSGLDLSSVNLSNTFLAYSDLSGSTLGTNSLSGASIAVTNLSGVDLSAVDLTNSRNGGLVACPAALPPSWRCVGNCILGPTVDLVVTDLSGQDLSGLDLTGARLWGINLTGANLAGAILAGVQWTGCICPDGTSAGTEGGKCCGHHVGTPPAVCN